MEQTPLSDESLDPRGPLRFWREALEGLGRADVLMFVLAWMVFQGMGAFAWATHLAAHAGQSALPTYWGEMLTARDVWEMAESGGLRHTPVGAWATLVFWVGLGWILWQGWRVQARAARLRPSLAAWVSAVPEAVVLVVLPLWLMGYLVKAVAMFFLGLGIPVFAGLATGVLGGLPLVLGSVLMLQWWLLRLERAANRGRIWGFESPVGLARHWAHGFLRLWLYPAQWAVVVVLGVLVRAGLSGVVLLVFWKQGGSSTGLVWIFAGLQALAAGLGALALAWFLRLVSAYWRHDRAVRLEIQALRASVKEEA